MLTLYWALERLHKANKQICDTRTLLSIHRRGMKWPTRFCMALNTFLFLLLLYCYVKRTSRRTIIITCKQIRLICVGKVVGLAKPTASQPADDRPQVCFDSPRVGCHSWSWSSVVVIVLHFASHLLHNIPDKRLQERKAEVALFWSSTNNAD